MKLENMLKAVNAQQIIGDTNLEVNGIHMDSRMVKNGFMFVAVKGTQADGHNYISKAIENGATVIVCEQLPVQIEANVTYVQLTDTEEAVGKLATTFYGDPTSKLELVGVTGTNGKTTIATLLYNMFRLFGYKAGLISTVCNYIDGEAIPTDHTTPDPITLNQLLGRMADEGCKYVFMEVSSHSVVQKRISGLTFAGGIFTNITRDHLDYHKTFENYLKAKKAFFDNLPKQAFALTNLDDKNGMVMTQNTKAKVAAYSLHSLCDFKGKVLEDSFDRIVDYAHTPDALVNVLEAIHEVLRGRGQVITVVGAGGNRDKGKRPLMAKESAQRSDKVIITSDNPRFEEPQDIINDMLAGLSKDDMKKVISIVDRKEAIRTACMLAQPQDVILIAGKGHETYQDVKGVKSHFDDKEVLDEIFKGEL